MDPKRITAGGVDFAYLELGDGPLALCLHGFPDSAHTWDRFLPALADRGFRAVAPWLRGFAPTAVPGDNQYQQAAIVADTIALHEALGGDEQAVIIGHDWGAMAAYGSGTSSPERWRRIVAMSIPPLPLVVRALFDYDQLRLFWYQFLFQLPLAEQVVAADDFAFIDRIWADWSPGLRAESEREHAKAALRPQGHLAAALGYYRALYDPARHAPELAELQQAMLGRTARPTLYLHGANDGCVSPSLGEGAEEHLAPGSRRVVVPDAGHFLHLDAPDVVLPAVLEFLQG